MGDLGGPRWAPGSTEGLKASGTRKNQKIPRWDLGGARLCEVEPGSIP